MNPPSKTGEREEDSVASTPDRELDMRPDVSHEGQAAFLPETHTTGLQTNGFLGSAMKWLAEVFADVG